MDLDRPTVPFLVGDGIGPEIWAATARVLDAAVARAYQGRRRISWLKLLAGDEALAATGEHLPEATIAGFAEHRVGIKGPLSTPADKRVRSLNITLRDRLDLCVCMRPIRWFAGVPSPVKHPERTDMVVFRENTEDTYAGVEFAAFSDEARLFESLLRQHFPAQHAKIRFPDSAGFGVKPISREGSERLLRAAFDHALARRLPSVTLVHKGGVMKCTEGAFRDWGYDLGRREYGGVAVDGGPSLRLTRGEHALILQDCNADAFLQQILTRPQDHSVIATMYQNGDYVSDAIAACVGGVGITPGVNCNADGSLAIFEAGHGSAPKYAGRDVANPSALILSGEMLLRHLGWDEAAERVLAGLGGALAAGMLTADLYRARETDAARDEATLLGCAGFADAVLAHM